ncbi:MAG: hypothetical protein HQL23_09175 [Candidatus Omnitrophica bacterium]|nr:hypothetical protein [Candidatus Omnitrophota bacterium]
MNFLSKLAVEIAGRLRKASLFILLLVGLLSGSLIYAQSPNALVCDLPTASDRIKG